jgi:class 3 adenylate cyclase
MAENEPIGYVVLDPGGPGELSLPLVDRIFVGRECAGVEASRRILLPEDPTVSRNHMEFRSDRDTARAFVFDTSSNGTRVNGVRIERSVGVPLSTGDRVQVGQNVIEFRAVGGESLTRGTEHVAAGTTYPADAPATMVIVVGDLINFSTVSEQADESILARDIDRLYGSLRELLGVYRGTIANYLGDAFFARWEVDPDPLALENALAFVIEAAPLVTEVAASLETRYADGSPMRMGWAVTIGSVVIHMMPGSVVMVLGDTVNVGFRLSSIAGREGRDTILVTDDVRKLAKGPFRFEHPETVMVKGRVEPEEIFGLHRG